jgi:Glutathione S-transferase, N-terminal domain
MLELYHHGSSVCAAKVRFALGEMRLRRNGHVVGIFCGEQFRPEFQALNAKAVVPVLVHDGFVIPESPSSVSTSNPGQMLRIPVAELVRFRRSYRMLSYVLTRQGYAVNSELAGADRTESVESLENEVFGWHVRAVSVVNTPRG